MLVQQMMLRLMEAPSFEKAVKVMLDDVVALHGAEFGNVQLPVGDELVIAAQRGFRTAFLKTFERVRVDDGCACGRALREGRIIVVPDVELDPDFAPYREAAHEAGFGACQSTPLVASDGTFVGMVSTHFVRVHRPTQIEMDTLMQYGAMAAEHLHSLAPGEVLSKKALAMNGMLLLDSTRNVSETSESAAA